jgi:hypothetical protein
MLLSVFAQQGFCGPLCLFRVVEVCVEAIKVRNPSLPTRIKILSASIHCSHCGCDDALESFSFCTVVSFLKARGIHLTPRLTRKRSQPVSAV